MKLSKEHLKKLIMEELKEITAPRPTRPDPSVRPAQASAPAPMPPPSANERIVFVVASGNRIFGVFSNQAQAQDYANKVKADVIQTKSF